MTVARNITAKAIGDLRARLVETGQRARARAGFTLVELLAVMAIMALAGMIVVSGIPAAYRAYIASVDASNAQVMLSTTTMRLRDVLSAANPDPDTITMYAEGAFDGETDAHQLIKFESLETGYATALEWNEAKGLFMVETSSVDDVSGLPTGYTPYSVITPFVPVASEGGAASHLHTEATSITYTNGAFKISGLKVVRDDGITLANAEVAQLVVHPIIKQ